MADPLLPLDAGWKQAWADRGFRLRLLVVPPVLVATLTALAALVKWVERRPGAVLPDPVLAMLPPRDATWPIFALIYSGILLAVFLLARTPVRLLLGVQAYVAMALLRIVVMWATPLDPPAGMIVLADPLVQVIGGAAEPLTRDLFFSGHTSTMFLLFLAVPGRAAKAFFLACTGGVAILVLLQHVHYTVDVLAAPVFAYAAWRVSRKTWPQAALAPQQKETTMRGCQK
ncbi:MAG: phosphatase PAP2-related protein [Deltaproteobacteria bacterium]